MLAGGGKPRETTPSVLARNFWIVMNTHAASPDLAGWPWHAAIHSKDVLTCLSH